MEYKKKNQLRNTKLKKKKLMRISNQIQQKETNNAYLL